MLVGIDVGGTKTHIRVEREGRRVLDLVRPTHDWQSDGLLGDEGNIDRLLGFISDLPGAHEAALVIGAHGLDSERQVTAFGTSLRQAHQGPTAVVNDVELLLPAAGFTDGIAVIAGTGSKVVGRDAEGNLVTSGGYGFLVSDPGSAPALVLAAARAVLVSHDDGRRPDALTTALLGYFDCRDVIEFAGVFGNQIDVHRWASAAPLIFQAADESSPTAVAVVEDAAEQLAKDVRRVRSRGAVGTNVVCAGGVISHQPRLFRAVTAAIGALDVQLRVTLLHIPPVQGAVELARSLSSARPSAAAIK
ncbi:MAG TPA: BadF/BadG/BcrA/BcrD ATPase family protein [Leifsonia sp.]|nr:BadF/BadG/BcrA/BcrD ATPase family protein [Leifsonia sp.]